MRILIDMDDVLTTCVSVWIKFLNRKAGKNITPDQIDRWEIQQIYPELTLGEVLAPLGMEAFWNNVSPIEDSVSYVDKLKEAGNEIIVVTASQPESYGYKLQVMSRYFPSIPMKNIVVAHDKSFICGDVLVDDRPKNLVESACKYGILFTTSHNKDFQVDNKRLFRANTWEEIYKLICHI